MARDVKDTRRDSSKEDKLKALDAAISQIEKQYGKGSVMKLGDCLLYTSHRNLSRCYQQLEIQGYKSFF